RRGQERDRLLADARCLVREAEAEHVLPAGLAGQAAERTRVAALLRGLVRHGGRVDSATALDELLLDVDSVGGDEDLPLEQCAHPCLRDLAPGTRDALLRFEAEVDLLVQ